ncbi:sensor histidine kinase [Paenisporosarcina cavernae]|uniref:Sensor histidine kinase n=1 Tax=Paenisporosarcina cavernae TaxID=2320858 RepID=A0A385YRM8_9BACL|nr:sensor histidine kinase [Paenisporosarcina cavernae]AYC28657.1 sensor histidine kinase [Paenisporosarcina cavernae]
MNGFFSRLFFLFFLLLVGLAGVLVSIWGWNDLSKWEVLLNVKEEIPLIAWYAMGIFVVSFLIAMNSQLAISSRERKVEASLQKVTSEKGNASFPKVSKKIHKQLVEITTLIETQQNSLKRLTDERAEGEEQRIQEQIIQERQRLARELHDSVSQQLFASSMLLSSITENEEEVTPVLLQAEKMVQQAQLEMRALLLHLRPIALHNKTMAEGLRDLVEELKQKVHFTIRTKLEEVTLSKGTEDHLFRIAQESLSNTLRHSKATEVDITLIQRDGVVLLRIQDNGVGFSKDEDKSSSYGLHHIEERAVEIGARSKVVSVPGEGTIVEVIVPMEKEEQHDSNSISR